MKEIAAAAIAKRVKHGEVIGVGTGSTVDLVIAKLAERVKAEQLSLFIAPSSYETAWSCEKAGLHVLNPVSVTSLDWGFDGADEVSPDLWLIKGRGGALLKEKILAAKCKKFIVVGDESKLVSKLGEKFAVPIEIIPESRSIVERSLHTLGATKIELREGGKKHGPVITEAGNIILDVNFKNIDKSFEREIKSIVGVVESGLFIGYASEAIIASSSGVKSLFPK